MSTSECRLRIRNGWVLSPNHGIYTTSSEVQGMFQKRKQGKKMWKQLDKEEDCERPSSERDTAIAISQHLPMTTVLGLPIVNHGSRRESQSLPVPAKLLVTDSSGGGAACIQSCTHCEPSRRQWIVLNSWLHRQLWSNLVGPKTKEKYVNVERDL